MKRPLAFKSISPALSSLEMLYELCMITVLIGLTIIFYCCNGFTSINK